MASCYQVSSQRSGLVAVLLVVVPMGLIGLSCQQPEETGPDPREQTLRSAAKEGRVEEVSELLAAGADPGAALFPAARHGQASVLRVVVEALTPFDRSIGKIAGAKALLYTIKGGHEEAADVLISAGASLEARYDDSRTILMEAATEERSRELRILLENGAVVDEPSDTGRTALFVAVEKGHARNVARLLAAGADPNHIDRDGWSPLMIAVRRDDHRILGFLLGAGADPNIESTFGWSALKIAARDGSPLLVEKLLEAGAELDVVTAPGHSPLVQAILGNHLTVTRLLISAGADPNKPAGGKTPLEWARAVGRRGIIELLAERTASQRRPGS